MIRSYQKRIGFNANGEPILDTFWEFKVRFIDENGIEKQKHLKCFKTRKACEKAMFNFLASQGNNTKREGLNFEYLFNQYKEAIWPRLRPNTIQTNTYLFNCHILPFFRNYLVSNIGVEDVLLFQKDLKVRKGYKDNYIKDITAQLKSFLNYCKLLGKIDSLPFDSRRTSVPIRDKKETTIWSLEEFNLFIEYYEDNIPKRALFYTQFYCGLRLKEALALEKRDFDFKKHCLKIQRTYIRVASRDYLEETTKTESSRRELFMCSKYEEVMEEFFDCNPELTKEERIFPYTQRRVYEWLKEGSLARSVPLTHPHALRNSLISNAISEGKSIKAVQKYVGHKSAKTTLDVYARSLKEDDMEVGNLYMTKEAV